MVKTIRFIPTDCLPVSTLAAAMPIVHRMFMQLRQHWRLAAALVPALLLGTSLFEHFRQLGWSRIGAGAAQFLAAFVLGIAILWVLGKLLPANRNVSSHPTQP